MFFNPFPVNQLLHAQPPLLRLAPLPIGNEFEYSFLPDARRAKAVVRLIGENTTTNYITHTEVLEGRAEHTRRWAHFRRSMLIADIRSAIRRKRKGEGGVLAARKGKGKRNRILGVAVLRYDKRHRYGVIEDIVVDVRTRGTGVGSQLMAAAFRTMKEAGMENVILESGCRNKDAHRFFKRHGFKEAAVMFMKSLSD